MMKRTPILYSLVALSCAIFLWSCKKDKPEDPIPTVITRVVPFTYTETAVIPAAAASLFALAPAGQNVDAYDGVFETNTDAELANEGFTREDVISIKGKSLLTAVVNTPGQTLDFLDTIRVSVSKKEVGSPKILFAYKYNYDLGKTSIDLDIVDVDVKDIFTSDSARIYFSGTKRAGGPYTIEPDTEINFNTTVEATVNVAQ